MWFFTINFNQGYLRVTPQDCHFQRQVSIRPRNTITKESSLLLGTLTLSIMRTQNIYENQKTVYLKCRTISQTLKQRRKQKHKEMTKSFIKNVQVRLPEYCKIIRNPFADHLFRKVNSYFIFPAIVTDAADKLFNLGCLQY